MKKFALATVLALAALGASAADLRLEYNDLDGKNGTASSTTYELGIKEAINQNFAADIVVKQNRVDNTDALSNRVEAGLTGTLPLGPLTGYTRVALGEKYTSGSAGYGYYSVEPGVIAPIAVFPGLSASIGYRFQDTFNDSRADLTRTWRTKLGYDINKSNNVYIGYDVQRGDSDANITKVGYIHKF